MSTSLRSRVLPLAGFFAGFLVLAVAAAYFILPHKASQASAVGGPFTLISQDGATVTQKALEGHPTLVFFGYTHCPDVCPATLAEISSIFKAIGPDNKAKALFVTVDPQRDTPPVMKDYLTSFDRGITGLTGSPEAIKSVERAYKAYAKAVPDKDGSYSMDHTAITYLMDKDGNFVGAFNLDRPPAEAGTELKKYF